MGLKARVRGNVGAGGSTIDTASVAAYRDRLLSTIDVDELSELDEDQRRARLERVVTSLIAADGPLLSAGERSSLVRRVVDDAVGLGVLEPLLADPGVTEIMVNGPREVYVERNGVLERSAVTFTDEEQLRQAIDRIVAAVNRRIDESSPMVDARLPTGERVNAVIPPLAIDGSTLTIRRFPQPLTADDLVRKGSLDDATVELLQAAVEAHCNIVVSGGTGTGKTTFLNVVSGFIGGSERIVTIEDAAELRLKQRHVIRLEARPANVEGRGRISIRDLVRNALRMRPDRIIVGEVRGGEALDMLQAMNTGHEGSLTTVHANTADDAVGRMLTLSSMSELELPYEALRDQVNSAVHLVVQLERTAEGQRRVSEVATVVSTRNEELRLERVMDRDDDGTIRHHLLPERLVARLDRAKVATPEAFTAGVAGSAAITAVRGAA
jgi:pilus assembly protein CpaF